MERLPEFRPFSPPPRRNSPARPAGDRSFSGEYCAVRGSLELISWAVFSVQQFDTVIFILPMLASIKLTIRIFCDLRRENQVVLKFCPDFGLRLSQLSNLSRPISNGMSMTCATAAHQDLDMQRASIIGATEIEAPDEDFSPVIGRIPGAGTSIKCTIHDRFDHHDSLPSVWPEVGEKALIG